MTGEGTRALRGRMRLAAAGLAVATLMLSGCVRIPDSSPVEPGDPPPTDAANEVDILVPGPEDGQTQQEVLEGFIQAALNPRNDYRVAREFLTDTFNDEWEAGAAATIDVRAERETQAVDQATMRVLATPAASLDGSARYEQEDSDTPIQLDYQFEQVDGEWRISSAPKGILIDQVGFAQVFRDYPLYFFDPTFTYLVPDVRWFSGPETVPTSIVQAILAGPSDWLASGVVPVPEGIELDPAAVPVSDDIASVSLVGTAFDDVPTRQRIESQLEASLVGVRNIRSVDLTLNGAEPGVSALSPAPVEDPWVDPRTVVFDGSTFGYLATSGDDGIDPIGGISDQIALLSPTGAALGPGAQSAAVLNSEGVWVVRSDEGPVLLDQRDRLLTPTIDGQGVVWSVPADAPNELAWYAADGSSGQVPVPWVGNSIAAIEISLDSTRIAALIAAGGNTHVVVTAIERDGNGKPIALGNSTLRLQDVSGTPLDIAWVNSSTVASITGLPEDATRILTQELGGLASQTNGPVAGVQIVGGNGDLRALTASGELDVQSGVGWQTRATAIQFVAAQQPD